MSEKKAVQVKVYGIVQGVGFRFSTVSQARRLGLTGYVRNVSDGSVEVVAEGKQEALDKLVKWLEKGPPGAIVRKVDVRVIPYRGFFRSFNIEF